MLHMNSPCTSTTAKVNQVLFAFFLSSAYFFLSLSSFVR
jgi:hypothetical protein